MKKAIRKGFEAADCRNEYTKAPYPYFDSQINAIAQCLQNAGYRKIADDDIVVTKAMQDGSCEGMDERTLAFFARHNAAVRKETAKEILREVWRVMWNGEPLDMFVLKLAEKYGVEVDE